MLDLKNSKLSDQDVIAQVLAGKKPLYEIIIRRYNPYLYKVGRSYNYNHQDTEDLMQDTFVDAFKNLSKFEGRSQFKTWIIRIMLNNCYRKKNRSRFKNEIPSEIHENSQPMFDQPANPASNEAHNNQLKGIIEEALSQIPEDYRMVFSLREINQLSTADTANLLDISASNVKVRLNRAKKKLREQIEKSYEPQELYDFHLIYCNAIVEKVMSRIQNF